MDRRSNRLQATCAPRSLLMKFSSLPSLKLVSVLGHHWLDLEFFFLDDSVDSLRFLTVFSIICSTDWSVAYLSQLGLSAVLHWQLG